jgi:hypothetical protein
MQGSSKNLSSSLKNSVLKSSIHPSSCFLVVVLARREVGAAPRAGGGWAKPPTMRNPKQQQIRALEPSCDGQTDQFMEGSVETDDVSTSVPSSHGRSFPAGHEVDNHTCITNNSNNSNNDTHVDRTQSPPVPLTSLWGPHQLVLRFHVPLPKHLAAVAVDKSRPIEWTAQLQSKLRQHVADHQIQLPLIQSATLLSSAFSPRVRSGWIVRVSVASESDLQLLRNAVPATNVRQPQHLLTREELQPKTVSGEIREVPRSFGVSELRAHLVNKCGIPEQAIQLYEVSNQAGQVISHRIKYTIHKEHLKLLLSLHTHPLTDDLHPQSRQHIVVNRRAPAMLCTSCGAVDQHSKKQCTAALASYRCQQCCGRGHYSCTKQIDPSRTACYICGKTGHVPRRCDKVWPSCISVAEYLQQTEKSSPRQPLARPPAATSLKPAKQGMSLQQYSQMARVNGSMQQSDAQKDKWTTVVGRKSKKHQAHRMSPAPQPIVRTSNQSSASQQAVAPSKRSRRRRQRRQYGSTDTGATSPTTRRIATNPISATPTSTGSPPVVNAAPFVNQAFINELMGMMTELRNTVASLRDEILRERKLREQAEARVVALTAQYTHTGIDDTRIRLSKRTRLVDDGVTEKKVDRMTVDHEDELKQPDQLDSVASNTNSSDAVPTSADRCHSSPSERPPAWQRKLQMDPKFRFREMESITEITSDRSSRRPRASSTTRAAPSSHG